MASLALTVLCTFFVAFPVVAQEKITVNKFVLDSSTMQYIGPDETVVHWYDQNGKATRIEWTKGLLSAKFGSEISVFTDFGFVRANDYGRAPTDAILLSYKSLKLEEWLPRDQFFYSIDPDGRREYLRSDHLIFDSLGRVTNTGAWSFSYDDRDNMTQVAWYENQANQSDTRFVVTYDSEGKLSQATITKADGTPLVKELYEYDDKEDLVKSTWIDLRDDISQHKSFYNYKFEGWRTFRPTVRNGSPMLGGDGFIRRVGFFGNFLQNDTYRFFRDTVYRAYDSQNRIVLDSESLWDGSNLKIFRHKYNYYPSGDLKNHESQEWDGAGTLVKHRDVRDSVSFNSDGTTNFAIHSENPKCSVCPSTIVRLEFKYERLSSVKVAPDRARVALYPNPAQDFVAISSPKLCLNYRVLDVLGRVVLYGEIEQEERVDISKLPPGYYLVSVQEHEPVPLTKL